MDSVSLFVSAQLPCLALMMLLSSCDQSVMTAEWAVMVPTRHVDAMKVNEIRRQEMRTDASSSVDVLVDGAHLPAPRQRLIMVRLVE